MTELADYDYPLPPELIAQRPVEPRDAARLLVWHRSADRIEHRFVHNLPDLLAPGDLLVLNRTRVFPARLAATKASGGRSEILLVHPLPPAGDGGERWSCLVRGHVAPGAVVHSAAGAATVEALGEDGERILRFAPGQDLATIAQRSGRIPLPPYIRRGDDEADRERYQTVYGDRPGSVAAPTAGLHFTPGLLARLEERGVERTAVELAVGPGTFRPVQVERIAEHRMHAERGDCPSEVVAAHAACHARGGRVVAVGTTVVRTLHSACAADGRLQAWSGWTDIFLHPPATLPAIDGLLTNFHLPRSTLLMLVACWTGLPALHRLYAEAVRERYRFFSYGDAMLLLP